VVALAGGWLAQEFAAKDPILAISNLNTYNLMFLMLGALLHWRPRSFLDAVANAVPATTGVLIQFPLYGGIAAILTGAQGKAWHSSSPFSSLISPHPAASRS
jgi:short-chain fatty acids transporter